MKRIFAFTMVVALLMCFAMPTNCKASVVHDHDVGWQIADGGPEMAQNFQDNTFEFHAVVLHNAANNSTTNAFRYAWQVPIASSASMKKSSPFKYWEGMDSKASRYGALELSNVKSYKFSSLDYGKGNRRLTCKAKA